MRQAQSNGGEFQANGDSSRLYDLAEQQADGTSARSVWKPPGNAFYDNSDCAAISDRDPLGVYKMNRSPHRIKQKSAQGREPAINGRTRACGPHPRLRPAPERGLAVRLLQHPVDESAGVMLDLAQVVLIAERFRVDLVDVFRARRSYGEP